MKNKFEKYDTIVIVGEVHVHSAGEAELCGIKPARNTDTTNIVYLDSQVMVLGLSDHEYKHLCSVVEDEEINFICLKYDGVEQTGFEYRWGLPHTQTTVDYINSRHSKGYDYFMSQVGKYRIV